MFFTLHNKNMIFCKDYYPIFEYKGMPEELKQYHCWFEDCGHSIMAIPKSIFETLNENDDLDMEECPVPVKYVLEKGYCMYENHVIVDAPYDECLGLITDEHYDEW